MKKRIRLADVVEINIGIIGAISCSNNKDYLYVQTDDGQFWKAKGAITLSPFEIRGVFY